MILIWPLLALILLGLPGRVAAARNLNFSADITHLPSDGILTLQVSGSGFTPGEKIYIKGVFFAAGSTNYFSLTDTGTAWVKCSARTDTQLQVDWDTWDRRLRVRPDFADSGFTGTGEYRFKIGYYYFTSSGNLSSVQWSTDIPISLVAPTPTVVPTPLPSSTPRPNPTTRPTSTPRPAPSLRPTTRPSVLPSLTPHPPSATPLSLRQDIGFLASPTPNVLGLAAPPLPLQPEIPQRYFSPGILLSSLGAGLIIFSLGLALHRP